MTRDELCYLSAVDLADLIRRQSISPRRSRRRIPLAHRRGQPKTKRLRHAAPGTHAHRRETRRVRHRARRTPRPAPRRARIHQGPLRHRRRAPHLRLPRGRHHRGPRPPRRATTLRCRCHSPRQDKHPRVRLARHYGQRPVWPHEQPLECRIHLFRFERRRGRGHRGGPRPHFTRLRRRRFHPASRLVLRHFRHQEYLRPHPARTRRTRLGQSFAQRTHSRAASPMPPSHSTR
jgi:hypothetical protein